LTYNFESLIEELKNLQDDEEKAKKIVEDANKEAEKIIRDAEEKSVKVISEQEDLMRKTEAKVRLDMKKETDGELAKISSEYVKDKNEIKKRSDKRMEEAVAYIVDEVLKSSI